MNVPRAWHQSWRRRMRLRRAQIALVCFSLILIAVPLADAVELTFRSRWTIGVQPDGSLRTIPLDDMKPQLTGLQGLQREFAEFSATMDSSEPDSAPADLLNRAIWQLVISL